jgi:hypothetical protein
MSEELYGVPTLPVLLAHANVGAAGEIVIPQFVVAVPAKVCVESTTWPVN